MKHFLLLISFSVSADTNIYQMGDGQSLIINSSSKTVVLDAQISEGLIQSFVGPCGLSDCEVVENTSFDVSYSVSEATNCIGSNGVIAWNTIQPSNDGLHTVSITGISQDMTFVLTCSNSVTGASNSVSINLIAGNGQTQCSTDVYPVGTSLAMMTYQQANDGFLFGESTGATMIESFRTDEVLVLSDFYTNNIDWRRRIATFQSPTNERPWHIVSWSISECPADFTQSAACSGVLLPSDGIFISTQQDGEPNNFCIIEPSKTYYLNFIHAADPYQGPRRCSFVSDVECAMFTSEVSASR